MKIAFLFIVSALSFLVLTSANLDEKSLRKNGGSDSKLSNLETQKFVEKLSNKRLFIVQEEKIKVSQGDCSEDPNSEFGLTQCVCKQGYIGDFPNCVLDCQPFNGKLTRDKSACVCKDFFIGSYPYCTVNCKRISNSIPNIYGKQCLCKQNFAFNAEKTQCLPTCNDQVGFIKIFDECIIDCSKICHSQPNSDGTECICTRRYFNDSGKCVKNCQYDIINSELNYQKTQCVCKPGFIKIENQCLIDCSKYSFSRPNPRKNECICREQTHVGTFPLCIPIQVNCSEDLNSIHDLLGTQCICKRGFNGQFPNCVQIILECPINSEIDDQGTGCICSKGYTGISPNCVIDCSHLPNTKADQNGASCICLEGFVCIYTQCLKGCKPQPYHSDVVRNITLPRCSQTCGARLSVVGSKIWCACPEFWASMKGQTCYPDCSVIYANSRNNYQNPQNCQCQYGYFNYSGRCILQIFCDLNEEADYGVNQCICKDGFYRSGHNCQINCSHIPNSVSQINYCRCQKNYENISGICTRVCHEKNTFQENGECVCIQGFEKIDGLCVEQCFENSKLSGYYCECISGYIRNGPKQCIINCNAHTYNSSWDGQKCVCDQGYVNISEACVLNCSNYQGLEFSEDLSHCVCIPGYTYISHLQCRYIDCSLIPYSQLQNHECVCISGFIKIDNQCIPNCSSIPNSYVDGDSCSCQHGYVKISGKCVQKCIFIQNSQKEGDICVCLEGYQNISGHCIKRCQLIFNSQLQGNQCRCKQGYQNISGYCMLPHNHTINCSTNPIENCQLIAHSQLIGGQCICQTGFINISGVCILNCSHICHSYPNQSGDSCICADNYLMNSQGTKCLIDCSKTLYSEPGESNLKCVCIEGYLHVNDCCVKDCSQLLHSHPDQTGSKCLCNTGYTFCKETKTCVKK